MRLIGIRWQGIRFALCIFVLATAPLEVAVAATGYWRTTLDRITVVANGSAQRCQRLATRLADFERAMLWLAGEDDPPELAPVALYSLGVPEARRAFWSASDARRMAASNSTIYSKFLPGADFHVLAIVDVGGGDAGLQSVLLFHAQNLMVGGATRQHPPWYQLGVAHLTNGVLVRDDGSVLLNRNPALRPTDSFGRKIGEKYDLRTVLAMTARETNAADIGEFIAVAREWAAYGLLGPEERRRQFRELAVLMRQGVPVEDAVRDAFGRSLAEVAAEFSAGAWRRSLDWKIVPRGERTPFPAPVPVAGEELDTLLGVVAARALVESPTGT